MGRGGEGNEGRRKGGEGGKEGRRRGEGGKGNTLRDEGIVDSCVTNIDICHILRRVCWTMTKSVLETPLQLQQWSTHSGELQHLSYIPNPHPS